MGKATLALSAYIIEQSNWSIWSPWGHKEGICDYLLSVHIQGRRDQVISTIRFSPKIRLTS